MAHINRFAAATALAAALSLAATPVAAAELPSAAHATGAYSPTLENVHDRGWGGGWGRRDHDRIDAGDVIAGVLVIGAIAAIASAASKKNNQQRPAAPPPQPYPEQRQGYSYNDSRAGDVGLDHAAGMCTEAIERGRDRVDSIDSVSRDRDGWSVRGALDSGDGFTCQIDNQGRIRGLFVGGPRADAAPANGDGQWSDEAYAQARSAQAQPDAQGDQPPAWVANRPVWHGDNAPPSS